MKTTYLWQDFSLNERINIYNHYIRVAQQRGDNTIYDFEEFDQFYYNCSFWPVAHMFGV